MKETFLRALHERKLLRVTFFSKEDGGPVTRTCAPMDYGPSRRAKRKNDRYHLWDYDSDTESHTLSLNPEQIRSFEILEDNFEPSEFVTWQPDWIVPRDWGDHS